MQGKISFSSVLKQFEKETHNVNTHSINKILIDENFLNDEEKLCQRIVIDWCSGLQHTEIYNKYVAKSSFKGKNAVSFAKKYLTDMVIKIKHRPEFRHLPNAPTKGSSKY